MGHKGKKIKRYRGKSRSLVKHFKTRIDERFDIELTQQDLEFITSMIRKGETIQSRKQTNRITTHIIRYKDRRMKVVYDKSRKLPVTCLFVREKDFKE